MGLASARNGRMESVHFNRPVSCMMLLKVSSSRTAIGDSTRDFGYTVLTWHAAQSRQGRTCVHRGEGRMRPLAILYPRLLYESQSRKHFCEQAGGRRAGESERALFIMKRRQVGLFGAKFYLYRSSSGSAIDTSLLARHEAKGRQCMLMWGNVDRNSSCPPSLIP